MTSSDPTSQVSPPRLMTEAEAIQESIMMDITSTRHQTQLDDYARFNRLISLNALVRIDGNCGADSMVVLTHPRGQQLSPGELDMESAAERVRLTNFLIANPNTVVPSPHVHGVTFADLPRGNDEHGNMESYSSFVTRMLETGQWLETPMIAAAAILHRRPIQVIVTSLFQQPSVEYFFPLLTDEAAMQATPLILGLRNTPTGQHWSPYLQSSHNQQLPSVPALLVPTAPVLACPPLACAPSHRYVCQMPHSLLL